MLEVTGTAVGSVGVEDTGLGLVGADAVVVRDGRARLLLLLEMWRVVWGRWL